MLKKVIQLLKLKSFPVFIIAFSISLGINAGLGNYRFYFAVTETFTIAEAESKLNTRIIAKCLGDSKMIIGTVISYHPNQLGDQLNVEIKWDKLLLEKYSKSNVGKEYYEQCIREINNGS